MTFTIMCSTPKELLDEYNKVMEHFGEDVYLLKSDYIGDCEANILSEVVEENGNNTAVVDAAYLVEEMRWNLIEKLQHMAMEACEFGEITEAKRKSVVRETNAACKRFKRLADKSEVVEPWKIADAEWSS